MKKIEKQKNKTYIMILIIFIAFILCINISVYAAYLFTSTDVKYIKPNGTEISVSDALDEIYEKVPSHEIGDEVTVGGEQFYVLEWDNSSSVVRLLSKYNLDLNGEKQLDAKYYETGYVFSSTNYWAGSVTNESFNLNDFYGYKDTDVVGVAKKYGMSKGALASGLLSYDELCELNKNKENANMLFGYDHKETQLYYWLSSAFDDDYVWFANAGSGCALHNYLYWGGGYYGVRPVITVLKTAIE